MKTLHHENVTSLVNPSGMRLNEISEIGISRLGGDLPRDPLTDT